MPQGHLCSLSGNGKRQRREEEEASCEAHHFGKRKVSQYPVPKSSGGRLCAREREGEIGIYFLCLEVLVRGLRHKFAASSALGRHRNKRLGRDLRCPKLRDS
jgi:hypothetical protein